MFIIKFLQEIKKYIAVTPSTPISIRPNLGKTNIAQISIRLDVGKTNVAQGRIAVAQVSATSCGHEVRVTLDPGLLIHPGCDILDEALNLLGVAVVGAKFSDPNGLAGHLICRRGVILEVLDVVPLTVPVNWDEVDLAVSTGV